MVKLWSRADLDTKRLRSAHEAEERLRETKPDVMVVDVIMESRTAGLDLVRTLSRVAPDVPALLVSAMHDVVPYRFVPNETWEPVVGFLDKPVAPGVLAERIEQILAN